MPPFAEFFETRDSLARDRRVDGNFLHVRAPKELFKLSLGRPRRNINSRRQHHRRFETNDAGRQASFRALDFDLESGSVRLEGEDRYEYRSVDEDY